MAESQDLTAEHAQAAARIEADVGVEHIANVYAKALLGAAENAAQTQRLLEEFGLLVCDVLRQHPRLEAILASGLISAEDKWGILDRVFGPRLSPMMLNFLKVAAHHGRLDCLKAIHRQTHRLYDKLRGRVHVEVTTARPLDGASAGRLAKRLRAVLPGEPVLRQATDPALIGGIVVRVGDTVYDGSIANQLENLRQQMIDRSAHEIQSRRDRFRYPAGN